MTTTRLRQLGSTWVTIALLVSQPQPAGSAPDPTHLFARKSRGNPLASDPRRVERGGVSIVVDVLDASRSQDVFGMDLLRRKIQPLVVKVYNGSEHAYQFRKADVQPAIVPAATIARLLKDPLWIRGAHATREAVSTVPRIVFPRVNKKPARVAGRETVQMNLLHDELADRSIEPKQFVNGFLFIPAGGTTPLTMTLTSAATQAPLVVNIPRPTEPS